MKRKAIVVFFLLMAACSLWLSPVALVTPVNAAVQQLTFHSLAIRDYRVSPNGQWVVYRLNDYPNGVTSLYSVPVTGGAPTRLAAVVTPNERFGPKVRMEFAIAPDSSRVLYFGRPDVSPALTPPPGTSGVRYPGYGLYSVPINGGDSTMIADDPHVHRFAFSPDSQFALFTSGSDADSGVSAPTYHFELYRSPVTGGGATRLNIDLPVNQSVAFDTWTVLKSGYVIYLVGFLSTYSAGQTSTGSVDVYSVPINGSQAQNAKLNPCGTVFALSAYAVTHDGHRVLIPGIDCDGGGGLRSVTPAGGNSVRLTPLGARGSALFFFASDDDRYAIFQFVGLNGSFYYRDLYISPVDGPSSEIHLVQSGADPGINPQLVADAPNGEWVAYTGSNSSSSGTPTSLYAAARGGTTNAPRLVTTNYPLGDYALISADSRYLIYEEIGGTFMSLDLTQSTAPVSLGRPSNSYTGLYTDAAADRVVFRDNTDGNLYSVPPSGPASALLRLSQAMVASYSPIYIVANGQKVLYLAEADNQLYIADINQGVPVPTQTPTNTLPPNCRATPGPTATAGPTRTPFPTEYPLFMPVVNQCHPLP